MGMTSEPQEQPKNVRIMDVGQSSGCCIDNGILTHPLDWVRDNAVCFRKFDQDI